LAATDVLANDDEAKKYFQQALSLDPKSHRAKTQLALYAYKDGGDGALESTIKSLEQAVLDAEFQNTEALVNALVKADKQFDFMSYPNRNHGIFGGNTTMHLRTLLTGFIARAMLHMIEPRLPPRAATAAAEPPDEPPGTQLPSHGLRTGP